jgi:hypothetical protein
MRCQYRLQIASAPKSRTHNRTSFKVPGLHMVTALGRSRPAADASREVVERWLLDGLM